jgi:hypothetical protein
MKVGILLSDPTEIKHPIAYIKETGRLSKGKNLYQQQNGV